MRHDYNMAVIFVVVGAIVLSVGIGFMYWPAGIAVFGALTLIIGFFGVEA